MRVMRRPDCSGANLSNRLPRASPRGRCAPAAVPLGVAAILLGALPGLAGIARAQGVTDMFLAVPAGDPTAAPVPTLKLEWTVPPNVSVTGIVRTPGGMTGAPGVGLPPTWPANTAYDQDWASGVRYAYHLVGTTTYFDPNTQTYVTTSWQGPDVYVTPFKLTAGASQSVDSRLDKRYGNPVFQDFKFGDRNYRGGLFAGYNGDGAKVGRSYLKFTIKTPLVAGEQLWNAGGLCLYNTRLARSGGASVTCRGIETATGVGHNWNPATLAWSGAPALLSSGSGSAVSLSYNASNPAPASWVRLSGALAEVQRELQRTTPTPPSPPLPDGTDLPLTLVALSGSEGSGGWAYFAKGNWVDVPTGRSHFGPILLFAYGGTGL